MAAWLATLAQPAAVVAVAVAQCVPAVAVSSQRRPRDPATMPASRTGSEYPCQWQPPLQPGPLNPELAVTKAVVHFLGPGASPRRRAVQSPSSHNSSGSAAPWRQWPG